MSALSTAQLQEIKAILRDAMSQSQLPFRVDICQWADLPASWTEDLSTEVLQ